MIRPPGMCSKTSTGLCSFAGLRAAEVALPLKVIARKSAQAALLAAPEVGAGMGAYKR